MEPHPPRHSDQRPLPTRRGAAALVTLILTAASALCLSAPSAHAETAADADSAISRIPAGLVHEVLEIDQSLRQHAEATAATVAVDPTRATTIYIASPVPRLLLLEMTLQIDNEPPLRYRYGQAESLALQSQALHRMARVPVSPGPHKLYAEYVARNPDDKPGTPRIRATLIQSWQQPDSAYALEIGLNEASFVGRPQIGLRQWVPAANGFEEAELRAIDLMIASGQEMTAAAELIALQRRNGSLPDGFGQALSRALSALRGEAVDGGSSSRSISALPEYQAAVAAGDTGMLDRLGRREAEDEHTLTLRDKANAALGFKLLDSGQGKAAAAALQRVRSPGPYSEVALLGLGWSQLVSADARAAQSTAPMVPVKTRFGAAASTFSSAHAIAADKQAADLRRALVPWTELIGRDPTAAAVQEAMLAIPYAMIHLGAHQQAQRYTDRAVEKLENTRAHLDQALEHIRSGGMYSLTVEREAPAGSGWTWWLASLPEPRWWLTAPPNAPSNFYMERLMQDDDYRRVLHISRRLFELDRSLAQHAARLADDAGDATMLARIQTLRVQLQGLSSRQRRELEAIAVRDIQQLKQQTENYLVEAHFAMARLHDRPASSPTPSGGLIP